MKNLYKIFFATIFISVMLSSCGKDKTKTSKAENNDIFGAGTTDRDRGGPWFSQIPFFGNGRIPSLTEMWLLQHFRNQNSIGYKFIPFEHRINMGHKFKVCIQ